MSLSHFHNLTLECVHTWSVCLQLCANQEKSATGAGLALAQKSVLPRLEALAEPWSAQAVSLACRAGTWSGALHKRPARARHRAL